MNIAILAGNVGNDPDLTHKGEVAIMKLRVATNERVKRGEEWTDEATWHNVTVFGKRAEGLAKVVQKGTKIGVQGRISNRSYEKDGQTRWSSEIVADTVELLGGGKGKGGGDATEPAKDPFAGKADTDFPFP